jgi:hypothetical protein
MSEEEEEGRRGRKGEKGGESRKWVPLQLRQSILLDVVHTSILLAVARQLVLSKKLAARRVSFLLPPILSFLSLN